MPFCTFDYLNRGLPLYTIEPTCSETNTVFQDGTVKVIVNSRAAEKAEGELRAFLRYMNGNTATTSFTKLIEKHVAATKENEQKRREYMLIKSFEMDAKRAGLQQGIQQGIQQGKSLGIAEGTHQAKRETAKLMKQHNYPIADICLITGLTEQEIAKLE